MIKLCVSGSKGKMGSRILEIAREDAELQITGEFDADINPEPFLGTCDCMIDFTSPEATMRHLDLCIKEKKPIVIGTTGISEADQGKIKEASKSIPVVFSPNMSVGVNLLFKMIRDAAKVLGHDYSVEILEAHHIQKKDAPSGTAKELARIVKDARGDVKIPIESVREDDIVGEHTVTFDSNADTLEITHSAKSRDIFAKGAIQAAKFIVKQKPGLYTMKDVLF